MEELTRDYKLAAEILMKKIAQEKPGIVATTLKSIVAAKGANAYGDIPKLAEELKAKGIGDSAIKQVELVLYGSSLVRYLDQLKNGLSAIDINNIILTAENAGLSPEAARKTVFDILYSLNVPQLPQGLSAVKSGERESEGALYIPPVVYESRIRALRMKVREGDDLTESDFSELNAFAQAGIPAAHTLLGQIYLEGRGVFVDEDRALENLRYAAAHGDAEAYGLLGDYYYGKDNKRAFEIYSMPGAMALNEKRKSRFFNLHKVKRYNHKQALLLVVLAAVIELFMLLFNTSVITGGHMTAFIVCSIINFLTVIGIFVVHLKNPYQDLRNLSLPFLIVFFIFAQILI